MLYPLYALILLDVADIIIIIIIIHGICSAPIAAKNIGAVQMSIYGGGYKVKRH